MWKLKDTQNRNRKISWDDIWIFQSISYNYEEQYSTNPNVIILIDYQAQSQYNFFIAAYESSWIEIVSKIEHNKDLTPYLIFKYTLNQI